MSVAGWYPDPAGVPNRLRYWDGQAWTTQVTDQDPTGSDGGGKPDKLARNWLWAGLAGVVVVALIVAMVIWNPLKSADTAGPAATYSPTISAWNESESPSPTPTPTPTPSQPHPSLTNLRCDQESPVRVVDVSLTSTRLTVGRISMPAPSSDWLGPDQQAMITYGEGAYGYTTQIETGWDNTMLIGPTNFTGKVSLETQARSIIACLAGTDVMDRYKAPVKLELKSVTISGHAAIQADASYSWNYSDLQTKGSLIRVVVVDTSDGPYYFLGEATKERADMIAVLKDLSAGLAVS